MDSPAASAPAQEQTDINPTVQDGQSHAPATGTALPAEKPADPVAGLTAAIEAQRLAGDTATSSTDGVQGEELKLVNRAAESKSPYVRSHKDNPVAWQLWTPETLALAKKHDKLIFLSIGYAACHWCHVMARESFSHPQIAHILNTRFLPIKLDREERPDIDRIYMNYIQAATGAGGWPLNVFLTPELEPLFGGTYWPGPGSVSLGGPAGDLVGLEDVLEKMAGVWETQRSRCREEAAAVTKELRGFSEEGQLGAAGMAKDGAGLELEMFEEAYLHFAARYDPQFSGFGAQPKFPVPVSLSFLLDLSRWPAAVKGVVGEEECENAKVMVLETLQKMADGGIKDQIGEGFARYSVTRDWRLPHFEKMLYDQALLLPLYTTAYTLTRSALYKPLIHDLCTYLTSPPLFRPSGGIHASEDADSLSRPGDSENEKREGAFYVWTQREFTTVLGEKDAEILGVYYGMEEEGNVDAQYDAHDEMMGQNVLSVTCTVDALAARFGLKVDEAQAIVRDGKAKLRAYRDKERPRPALDDKIVTSWNGLAIGSLARASAVLAADAAVDNEVELSKAKAYLDAAVQTADFIRKEMYDETEGSLKRVWREGPGDVNGFAEDYAFLIQGLLELYEATFEERWLQWAQKLQDTQLTLFAETLPTTLPAAPVDSTTSDPSPTASADQTQPPPTQNQSLLHNGFFSTPSATQAPDTLLRLKSGIDDSEPSANAISASNLFRLGSLLGQSRYTDLAVRTVKSFEDEMGEHPFLFPGLLGGVVWATLGGKGIVICGPSGDAEVEGVVRKVRMGMGPGTTVLRVGAGLETGWLREGNETVRGLDGGRKVVLVCEGTSCRELEFGEVDSLFAEAVAS